MAVLEKKKKKSALTVLVIIQSLLLVAACLAVWYLYRDEAIRSEPVPPYTLRQTEQRPTLPPPEANPYYIEDFKYEGEYLTCLAGDAVMGIDVSEFQTVTDWQAVKDAGVEFVILRAGARGYGAAGTMWKDEAADSHYEGAKSVGLKVGVYFFSQAVNTQEAVEEARLTLDIIKDWDLDLPVVFDWEYVSDEARTAHVYQLELTHITLAYCQTMRDAGYEPMVYFNTNQSFYLLQMERLTEYDFWLAMYSDHMDYPYAIEMWQYSSTGKVPGIEEPVDLNLMFLE